MAVGRETPLPDIAIEDVDAPSYGLLGEQISLPVRLRNDFSREVSTKLQLLDGLEDVAGEESRALPTILMEKEVLLPPEDSLLEAVVWEPKKTGERNLRLRLVSEPDELLADNNERALSIRIRLETLKVLVVDSKPRWEYRYLRNALERDPGVQMHCILFHPGLATGAGRHYLPSFPGSKERIADYDVIFLGDVGAVPEQLKESDLELIRGLVEQQAGGLVFLPGRSGFQKTLLNGPLADLIPVVLDRQKPGGIALQNESRLALSTFGKRHWLTRFDAKSQKNDELWRQLPGFYWCAAVEKSRPGSEVLAVHSAVRNSWGRIPLLVTRSFGNGKVLFMGTDSAWRWRRGVEDKYHYRFWSQIVRWMAHQRHLSKSEGIRLTWTPEVAEVGDKIHLQALLPTNPAILRKAAVFWPTSTVLQDAPKRSSLPLWKAAGASLPPPSNRRKPENTKSRSKPKNTDAGSKPRSQSLVLFWKKSDNPSTVAPCGKSPPSAGGNWPTPKNWPTSSTPCNPCPNPPSEKLAFAFGQILGGEASFSPCWRFIGWAEN